MTTPSRPLHFVHRGRRVTVPDVPPDRTLLEVLREDLHLTGTKEGCGEGDCGACTVVLAQPDPQRGNALAYKAINACIRMAHSVEGMALWTAEDLAEADGTLHPVQEAMVQCHGSQCGFCTPGFVMSLFGMYQKYIAPTLPPAVGSLPSEGALALRGGPSALKCQGRPVTRALAAEELSGNLCRCTGYRPILDAAEQMGTLPPVAVDEAKVLQQLELLAQDAQAREANLAPNAAAPGYLAPTTLAALVVARAAHPQAQIVAGATDVGLWITKQHRQFAQMLDVTRVQELLAIDEQPDHLAIGAAVTLTDAFAALQSHWPTLHRFAARFAGLPVRNSGTLGGNVANGSPIGDSMPLLIALRARAVLASVRGERSFALEDLYTGYRQNVLASDEVLARIVVPLPEAGSPPPYRPAASAPSGSSDSGDAGSVDDFTLLRAYKVSKRFDDDISAVCLVLDLQIEDGVVRRASIGAGGVAATPMRARATEAALAGQPWTEATVARAAAALQAEFSPISDMRASGAYRRTVLGSLLQRFWLESQGAPGVTLDQIAVEAL